MTSRNLESYISFPGLGIGEFKLNSVAFTVFGYEFVWYGIIITLGIVAAVGYVMWRAKQEHIKSDDILDLATFTVLAGLIGARLYYVLTNLDTYVADNFFDTLYNFIAVWKGGLAIYGGIIAGALAAFIVLRIKKLNIPRVFDMLGPAVMLGQLIGRWGNFMNAEAFGDVTDLPWRMGIRNRYHYDTIFVHPTFLYESLWNLIGFILINLVYKKKKFDGQIILMYFAWYGLGRMFIEGIRADSLYVGEIRISQLVAFVTCIASVLLLIFMFFRAASGKTKPTVYMQPEQEAVADSDNAAESGDVTEPDTEAEPESKPPEQTEPEQPAEPDDIPEDENSEPAPDESAESAETTENEANE